MIKIGDRGFSKDDWMKDDWMLEHSKAAPKYLLRILGEQTYSKIRHWYHTPGFVWATDPTPSDLQKVEAIRFKTWQRMSEPTYTDLYSKVISILKERKCVDSVRGTRYEISNYYGKEEDSFSMGSSPSLSNDNSIRLVQEFKREQDQIYIKPIEDYQKLQRAIIYRAGVLTGLFMEAINRAYWKADKHSTSFSGQPKYMQLKINGRLYLLHGTYKWEILHDPMREGEIPTVDIDNT